MADAYKFGANVLNLDDYVGDRNFQGVRSSIAIVEKDHSNKRWHKAISQELFADFKTYMKVQYFFLLSKIKTWKSAVVVKVNGIDEKR